MASAYVKLTKKGSTDDLGTFLVSQLRLKPERVAIDGKNYELRLQFKTTVKPYSLKLLDVRKDDYMGTNTPRNYSSLVHLVDESRGVDREKNIWMNNPLRYAGETIYQSSYDDGERTGKEGTGLQIVTNTGWMIPYVGCMVVMIGMVSHFWVVLVRFIKRATADNAASSAGGQIVTAEMVPENPFKTSPQPRRSKRKRRQEAAAKKSSGALAIAGVVVPVVVVAVGLICTANSARTPRPAENGIDWYAAGKIPVMFEGRLKPLDTLARNSLRVISDKDDIVTEKGEKISAIRWLFDLIADAESAREYRMFRIENSEVRDLLGLKRREHFRYSLEEIAPKFNDFIEASKRAHEMLKQNPDSLGTYERKVLEADERVRHYMKLRDAFQIPSLPPFPTAEDDEMTSRRKAVAVFQAMGRFKEHLRAMNPPLAVPGDDAEEHWQALSFAQCLSLVSEERNPVTTAWTGIILDYRKGDVLGFNDKVADYRALLEKNPPAKLNLRGIDLEAYINDFQPFLLCRWLYIGAFVVTLIGMACFLFNWQSPFLRGAAGLIVLTFIIHSLALLARIYISGRPPVTNLYSSAVFIGLGGGRRRNRLGSGVPDGIRQHHRFGLGREDDNHRL